MADPQISDPAPVKLKEYEYMVGHMPVTAMLTEAQAERLGATEVGKAKSPGEGNVVNNEAERQATAGREADDAGVDATHPDGTTTADTAEKTRTARNKRAS